MSKIFDYAKEAKLMDIRITYNGETYKFNLASELKIDQVNINIQLKKHSTSYAFLCMLLEKFNLEVESMESSKEKLYNQLYVTFKTSKSTTYFLENKKFPSDDLCKALALSDKKYSIIIKRYLNLKNQRNTLKTAVKAFEQRAFLLQTLSANNRKQI